MGAPRASSCGSPDDDALISGPTLDNFTGRGIHHKVIGSGRAGDDGFSQAGIRVDDGLTPFACHRMSCEEHARNRGFDHALHHHSQLDAALIEAQALPIAHRPISPERGEAAPYRVQHRLDAHDVEGGLLLAGKAGKGEIFSRGRGAHCHRERCSRAQNAIGFGDSIGNDCWNGGCQNAATSSLSHL